MLVAVVLGLYRKSGVVGRHVGAMPRVRRFLVFVAMRQAMRERLARNNSTGKQRHHERDYAEDCRAGPRFGPDDSKHCSRI
jgi:hypothetical protein